MAFHTTLYRCVLTHSHNESFIERQNGWMGYLVQNICSRLKGFVVLFLNTIHIKFICMDEIARHDLREHDLGSFRLPFPQCTE